MTTPTVERTPDQPTWVTDSKCSWRSSQGYHKQTGAIRPDQVLHDLEGANTQYGSAYYYTTVYGAPEDANWAWMLTGHHIERDVYSGRRSHRLYADVHGHAPAHGALWPRRWLARAATGRVTRWRAPGVAFQRPTGHRHPGDHRAW